MATRWLSPFSGCARLHSRAHDFQDSIEKICGKLGRYVSFNEINVRTLITVANKSPGSMAIYFLRKTKPVEIIQKY